MKDSNNHVDKLSESIDKPLPSKNGAERGLTSPFPSNYGQPEALRILGEIAERFINGQTLSTRADLNNIIKSVRGEGKDELTRNSNNASEYDDSGYQTRILSPEQNMLIKQQGISIANPGQELEAYGSGIRGILRGYFPTVEYRLGLIGFESIEARRTKVDIGELEKILDECREKFEKYAEMSINYRKSVEELPNFAVLQNSSKYKEDLGQHEDAFMSLQTALEEFSTQFLDKRAALQRIFKAAQEIVDKFKHAPEYKGKLVWETSRYLPMLPLDIIENPEFPRGIVANPKLARKMLANPELLEDIRYKPGLLKSIIGNRKLAQDVQANRNLAQDVANRLTRRLRNNPNLVDELVREVIDNPDPPRFPEDVENNPELFRHMLDRLKISNITQHVEDNPLLVEQIVNNPQFHIVQYPKADPKFVRDIVLNRELARFQLARYKLARYKLGKHLRDNRELVLDIVRNRKLVRDMMYCPEETKNILKNFELAQDIAADMNANLELAEMMQNHPSVTGYVLDNSDVFKDMDSVVTMKKNAAALVSKISETKQKLSLFQQITVPDLLASIKEPL